MSVPVFYFVSLQGWRSGWYMRTPGVEPGSQAWGACMIPLRNVRRANLRGCALLGGLFSMRCGLRCVRVASDGLGAAGPAPAKSLCRFCRDLLSARQRDRVVKVMDEKSIGLCRRGSNPLAVAARRAGAGQRLLRGDECSRAAAHGCGVALAPASVASASCAGACLVPACGAAVLGGAGSAASWPQRCHGVACFCAGSPA